MADNYGRINTGSRVTNGGGFYAVAVADVAGGKVYMPKYATSAQFGMSEAPVESGKLGFFATEGTFAFAKPTGHTSVAGQEIYYAPTDAVSGSISTTPTEGSVLLGWEVVRADVPAGLIFVDLARPTALEPAAATGGE